MGETTGIEWTDHTFNPWWGCAKVSPACDHCYAETWAAKMGQSVWGLDAPRKPASESTWREPLRWARAAQAAGVRRRVFCASMADVAEARADLDPARARLFKLIDDTRALDWLLLTKRPHRWADVHPMARRVAAGVDLAWASNIWLGTTVENQKWAEVRIPQLLRERARCQTLFLSVEPLLEPIDLRPWLSQIDWVIVGGESGEGSREMQAAWVRSLRDQCVSYGVPFYFKQWGDMRDGIRVGKKKLGSKLDGVEWKQFPPSKLPAGQPVLL